MPTRTRGFLKVYRNTIGLKVQCGNIAAKLVLHRLLASHVLGQQGFKLKDA
jgi:Zn-dependent protease